MRTYFLDGVGGAHAFSFVFRVDIWGALGNRRAALWSRAASSIAKEGLTLGMESALFVFSEKTSSVESESKDNVENIRI